MIVYAKSFTPREFKNRIKVATMNVTIASVEPFVHDHLYYILQRRNHWIYLGNTDNAVLIYLFEAYIAFFWQNGFGNWMKRFSTNKRDSMARQCDNSIRKWLEAHGLDREVFVHCDEVLYLDPAYRYLAMDIGDPRACSSTCTRKAKCWNKNKLIECNNTCKEQTKCSNQESQSYFDWQQKMQLVYVDYVTGVGIVAKVNLREGEYLGEYTGEAIRHIEKGTKAREESNYLFSISKNEEDYPVWAIDSKAFGNHCRFVNHCCSPNCLTETWIVGGKWIIKFRAKRAISQVCNQVLQTVST